MSGANRRTSRQSLESYSSRLSLSSLPDRNDTAMSCILAEKSTLVAQVPAIEALPQARARLEQFTAGRARRLQGAVDAHRAFLAEAQLVLHALREEQTALRVEAARVEDELRREKALVDAVTAGVGALRKQSRGLPARLREIREREDTIRGEVQRLEAEVEKHVRENDRTNSDLTQGVIAFKTRLGLDFERIGQDQLKLNLTRIDPSDPERVFAFAVHIDPNDKYHVILCDPPLNNTDELVDELNMSNDFSLFVRRMRRSFRALAAAK
jgi:chromosome segregation ATPase